MKRTETTVKKSKKKKKYVAEGEGGGLGVAGIRDAFIVRLDKNLTAQ